MLAPLSFIRIEPPSPHKLRCHRQEYRRTAERIDDWQQGGQYEQHGFDEVAEIAGHVRAGSALALSCGGLRSELPGSSLAATRGVRDDLRRAGRRGRIYSRAYRADPSDNSLPQEAAFENSLLRLERTARHAGLRACSIRLATP